MGYKRVLTIHRAQAQHSAEMESFTVVVFLLLCGMATGQRREYIYVGQNMTWTSAQNYCREKYMDLATITSDEENQRLASFSAGINNTNFWIGLNRTEVGVNIWQWSDGEPTNFFKWRLNQPDDWKGVENCGSFTRLGWNDAFCEIPWPFFCSWRVSLVKENKTWDEALDYCRTHYTGLASPVSTLQFNIAENLQPTTASIWTGLRFMDGRWFSVSRTPLDSLVSLPSCPAQRYRCGARNTVTQLWENKDCDQKFNFLCE